MRCSFIVGLIALHLAGVGYTQDDRRPKKIVGAGCNDCEPMFEGIPKGLRWRTTVAGDKEMGKPLVIRSVIYQNDGKTPELPHEK